MVSATSFSTRLTEYVPVVYKAVDATWKREQAWKAPFNPQGLFFLNLVGCPKDLQLSLNKIDVLSQRTGIVLFT